ncbi:MAG: FAM166 family protein [archaeon]|nr:FAM166 family protein [archaeon]
MSSDSVESSMYPTYMAGYTGHIPNIDREEIVNRIVHTKHIPGYGGFIPSIKSENKFGESYGKETSKSIKGEIPKGADVPPYSRYTSTARESYVNQRSVKTQSTAELLGIGDRKINYKKPIPIDTINKYWGVDTKKNAEEEVVQKQTYEGNYRKFWEFIDSNELDYIEKPPVDFNISNNAYWGVQPSVQELHPELKYDPIPGYQGMNRAVYAENIFGMTYKNSIRKASELLDKIKEDKAQQLYKSSMSTGPYAKMY